MGQKAVSHLLFYLGVLATGLLLAVALFSRQASFMPPSEGEFWPMLGLLMPVILLMNGIVFVWWMVHRRWLVALIPVAAVVLNMGYIASMIQLPDYHDGDDTYDLRIATLNANGFRRMNSPDISAAGILRVASGEQLDVICLQEYSNLREIPADSLASLFAAREMPYFVHEKSQAIASRFPILDSRYVSFPDSNNDYLWADLLVGGDTVRVVSVHLQTTGISSLLHRFRKDFDQDVPVDLVLGSLEQNSRVRATQVEQIRAVIDATPYPVILLGDFNDTPSSYTYRRMKGDLIDGFRALGNGFGATFRGMGGVLRIDYILYDDSFQGVRYYMPKEDVSDHKMVVADLRIKRS